MNKMNKNIQINKNNKKKVRIIYSIFKRNIIKILIYMKNLTMILILSMGMGVNLLRETSSGFLFT